MLHCWAVEEPASTTAGIFGRRRAPTEPLGVDLVGSLVLTSRSASGWAGQGWAVQLDVQCRP